MLGAVPPYSSLLFGKLVALLAASEQVREAFHRKYAGRLSVIRGRPLSSQLVAITTTSAMGRSSIYNRLKFRDRTSVPERGLHSGIRGISFCERPLCGFVRLRRPTL